MRSVVILALAMVVLGCAVEATEAPPVAQAAAQNRIEGTVLETLDAVGYTYVRFDTPDGEVWAAVIQADLEIGAWVIIENPQEMVSFESKTLGRTFDSIYFGTLEDQHDPHGSMQGGMERAVNARNANTAPIDVDKAEGATGRTIAELYAERDDFSGEVVSLRGKVVKYSADIMGRNWIHLQDGTGNAADGTDDITVTSLGVTTVGDIILVQGTVAVDRDFGAGYRYDVIVEDASVN